LTIPYMKRAGVPVSQDEAGAMIRRATGAIEQKL
jgi:hypothetical protein